MDEETLELTNTGIFAAGSYLPEHVAQAPVTAAWDAQDREDIRLQSEALS
jgi:hypothetical protein